MPDNTGADSAAPRATHVVVASNPLAVVAAPGWPLPAATLYDDSEDADMNTFELNDSGM